MTVSSAEVSPDFGTKHTDAVEAGTLSVALIGPDAGRRSAVARALAETRRADVRQFDSYPPGLDHLQRLLASFDVIILDLDSDLDVALELVEKASASDAATIMVYSEKADPKLAISLMRAGAREYLLLPLEQGAVAEALVRATTTLRGKPFPAEKTLGGLLVFFGSKGGCGVTTVACNVAIALAKRFDQRSCSSTSLSPLETRHCAWGFPQATRRRTPSGISTGWMRVFFKISWSGIGQEYSCSRLPPKFPTLRFQKAPSTG